MNKSKDEIQQEALSACKGLLRCGLGISMGVGKTRIGLLHMEQNPQNKKILVVAPKLSIFETWKEEASKFGLDNLLDNITFSTYLSLSKQQLDYDWVYLDECHNLLKDSHEEWLDKYQGGILGLTGTPPRFKTSEKGKMISKFCPIVYNYDVETAVNDNILNDYEIIIHYLPLSKEKSMRIEHKDKAWYTSEVESYNYWSNRIIAATNPKSEQIARIGRMRAMMGFPSKEIAASKIFRSITDKCILFANSQEQADRLCSHSYHANNDNSEQNLKDFKEGKINKLSAVLQLNEGANIPNLKVGIIMHSYSNERKSSQRIGRLLRLNPDDKSTIHILCYENTIDEKWVDDALLECDPSKIKRVRFSN